MEQELIKIALQFINNALNGTKENNTDYYITTYNYSNEIEIVLHNTQTNKFNSVYLNTNGTIYVVKR